LFFSGDENDAAFVCENDAGYLLAVNNTAVALLNMYYYSIRLSINVWTVVMG